jgi:ABC-type transport system substrate-binding protein
MVIKYRTLTLVALLIFIFTCSFRNSEFHVALGDIPTRLTPDDADVNTVLYIVKQLHQPLFTASLTGYADSQLLKSWYVSSDERSLTLCLKDNLKFSNNRLVTTSDILANIRYFNEKNTSDMRYPISNSQIIV